MRKGSISMRSAMSVDADSKKQGSRWGFTASKMEDRRESFCKNLSQSRTVAHESKGLFLKLRPEDQERRGVKHLKQK